MFRVFRILRPSTKQSLPLSAKIILIILVFLFLALQGLTIRLVLRLQQSVSNFQAESRQKIDQMQSAANYSSSLLWMLKGQVEQWLYQVNFKR